MDRKKVIFTRSTVASIALLVLLVPSSGCIMRMTSNLIHAWNGHLVEAKFTGLQGKRVAVVCLSGSTMYSGELAMAVERLLANNVPDIETVPQTEVYAWQDTHEWDELDFKILGKGVKADLVVAIELSKFRLYDGQTMYKGRANITTSVYDMSANGQAVYSQLPTEHVFPANAAYATTDMSEDKFRKRFMISLARSVAKDFYSYDIGNDFAANPTLVGQ